MWGLGKGSVLLQGFSGLDLTGGELAPHLGLFNALQLYYWPPCGELMNNSVCLYSCTAHQRPGRELALRTGHLGVHSGDAPGGWSVSWTFEVREAVEEYSPLLACAVGSWLLCFLADPRCILEREQAPSDFLERHWDRECLPRFCLNPGWRGAGVALGCLGVRAAALLGPGTLGGVLGRERSCTLPSVPRHSGDRELTAAERPAASTQPVLVATSFWQITV